MGVKALGNCNEPFFLQDGDSRSMVDVVYGQLLEMSSFGNAKGGINFRRPPNEAAVLTLQKVAEEEQVT